MTTRSRFVFVLVLFSLATPILVPRLIGADNSVAHSQAHAHPLLETGHPAKLRPASESLTEMKIVSYNIRWRGGNELRKLAQLFKDDPEIGSATILGLQEVDRNRKRTGNKNTVKHLADELGMNYAWAAPPATSIDKEEETGVAILSAYPLSQVHRILLPHPGPQKRRRVAIGATITIGTTRLRFYSVHSENRMAVERKLEQMKAVLADLKNFPADMPAIILGDLNTWENSTVVKTIALFKNEGFATPFDARPTFSQKILFIPIDLKLDWIWLRHLQSTAHGVDREIGLSDHWPLWIRVRAKLPAGTNVGNN